MGIKICPDCSGKVSDSRSECPHCGYIFGAKIKCPDCGKELGDSCLECPDCGYVFKPKPKRTSNPPVNVKVVVQRARAFVGSAVASVISVDGAQVGSVNNGEECTFFVSPGLHSFSIGKGQSGPIMASISDAVRQIDVKAKGVLTIRFVNRTKMLLGFYSEILSVEQK